MCIRYFPIKLGKMGVKYLYFEAKNYGVGFFPLILKNKYTC